MDLEIDKKALNIDENTGDLSRIYEGNLDNTEANVKKAKTSLRMYYEAQVLVIKKQLIDLEHVRMELGLSGRKMAQLLLVDPSAWTRWTKSGDEVPPHVWRALQWYMIIQEKIPGLSPQYFIGKDFQAQQNIALKKVDEVTQNFQKQNEILQNQNKELETKLNQVEKSFYYIKLMMGFFCSLFVLLTFGIIFWFFKK